MRMDNRAHSTGTIKCNWWANLCPLKSAGYEEGMKYVARVCRTSKKSQAVNMNFVSEMSVELSDAPTLVGHQWHGYQRVKQAVPVPNHQRLRQTAAVREDQGKVGCIARHFEHRFTCH